MSTSLGDMLHRHRRRRVKINFADGPVPDISGYIAMLEQESKKMTEKDHKGKNLIVFAVPKAWAVANKEAIMADEDTAILSILDTDALLEFPEEPCKSKTFWFDDIHPTTTMTVESCRNLTAMNMDQAEEIVGFICGFVCSGKKKLVIHCTAGVCRSGAVVDFCRVFLDLDPINFIAHNPNIIPNTWVRDLLWAYVADNFNGKNSVWEEDK